jgi:hypothetical protein
MGDTPRTTKTNEQTADSGRSKETHMICSKCESDACALIPVLNKSGIVMRYEGRCEKHKEDR